MKKSELLEKAKEFLWDGYGERFKGKENYVCIALSRAMNCSTCSSWGEMEEIKEDIRELIRPCYTIEEWLFSTIGYDIVMEATSNQLQDYRLRWMDQMIAEYKSKGD